MPATKAKRIPRPPEPDGEIGVDSARVAFVDPDLLDERRVELREDGSIVYRASGIVVGYWTPTAFGDGVFPVYVQRDEHGAPEGAVVSFSSRGGAARTSDSPPVDQYPYGPELPGIPKLRRVES